MGAAMTAEAKPFYQYTCDRFRHSHKAPRTRCRGCDLDTAITLLRETLDIEPDAWETSHTRLSIESFLEQYDIAMKGGKEPGSVSPPGRRRNSGIGGTMKITAVIAAFFASFFILIGAAGATGNQNQGGCIGNCAGNGGGDTYNQGGAGGTGIGIGVGVGTGGNATAFGGKADANASSRANSSASSGASSSSSSSGGAGGNATINGGVAPDKISVRNTPDVSAPPALTTSPCVVGISAGFGIQGFGFSGGSGVKDEECDKRAAIPFAPTRADVDYLFCQLEAAKGSPTCVALEKKAAVSREFEGRTIELSGKDPVCATTKDPIVIARVCS